VAGGTVGGLSCLEHGFDIRGALSYEHTHREHHHDRHHVHDDAGGPAAPDFAAPETRPRDAVTSSTTSHSGTGTDAADAASIRDHWA
jgi:hypothetical protein